MGANQAALLRSGKLYGTGSAVRGLLPAGPPVPTGPLKFSQSTASPAFSAEGTFSGKSISQVADALRSGTMKTSQVPVEFIVCDGNRLIVNTRSSLALRQAGVPESQWNLINRSGVPEIEANITSRLIKNSLGNEGTSFLRITGSGPTQSTYRSP